MRIADLFILTRRKVPSLSAPASLEHPKRGTCFPDGERCPHFPMEDTMFTDVKRASCAARAPVCVLLGGSGQRSSHLQKSSPVPALFRPWSSQEVQACELDRTEAELVEA